MVNYIVRRILIAVPLLLAMSFVTFVLMKLAPGDVLAAYRLNPQFSEETIRRIEQEYGIGRPPFIPRLRASIFEHFSWFTNLPGGTWTADLLLKMLEAAVQYLQWLRNLLVGNLGYSFTNKAPVTDVIKSKLRNTLLLSIASLLMTWLLAIPMGIYCAVHRNTITDKLFSFLAFFGMAIPDFFFALLLVFIASATGILPTGGATSEGYEAMSAVGKGIDLLEHLIIPTVVISTGSMAVLQRIMRGNMLEVLREQYVTTARAKGLPENRVIYRHALRNAINPMVTIFGYELSALLSGAALVEIVCGWPGIGITMLTAVRSKDIFLVMGSMMIGGVMLLVGNLVADLLLALVDPRIRYD